MKNLPYIVDGDVVYKQIDMLPKGLKKQKGNLIHQGNNHQHILKTGKFSIYLLDSVKYIKIDKASKTAHGEHTSKTVPKGFYKIDIQIEYDHILEESRKVID